MDLVKVLALVVIGTAYLVCICVDGSPWDSVPALSCTLKSKRMVIEENNCRSNKSVVLTYCEGRCRSASIPTYKYPYFKPRCKCCRASLVTSKEIKLDCPNTNTTTTTPTTKISNQSRRSIVGGIEKQGFQETRVQKPNEKYAIRDVALSCKCETCAIS